MNTKIVSLNSWADELFDLFDNLTAPKFQATTNAMYMSTGAGAGSSTLLTTTAGGSGWDNTGGVHYNYTIPAVKFDPIYWYTPIETYIHSCGTPWDNVSGFPPLRVEANKDTKALRFTWALAGVDKDLVDLEFDEDKMVLIIKKDDEDKDKKKKESVWAVLKNTIKTSISGEYKYDVPAKRYEVAKATAKWDRDLLVVEVPVREELKPLKVKIS